MRYGNGMTRNIDRDPNYNYRLRESMTQGPDSGILLDTHYTYNALDAITRISEDGIEPLRKTIDYSYDALDRLTRGQYEYALGGFGREKTKDLSYLYDDRGNIMNASSIGIYSYSETENANPYAVTHAGGTSYDYDRSGNTRTRVDESGTLSFTYSSYGEMLSSERGGIMTDYLYDHTRRRIQKSTP